MRRVLGAAVVLVTMTTGVSGASAPSATLNLLGDVYAGAQPIDAALVISFGLSSFQASQTVTDSGGNFRFPPLPNGVYRVIAVKSGFAPAVVTVVPSDPSLSLKLKLRRGEAPPETRSQIWEIRRSLPADILREVDIAMGLEEEPAALDDGRFGGAMTSLTSIDSGSASGSVAQTSLALRGALPAGWRVDIAGRHVESGDSYLEGAGAQQMRSSGVQMSLSTEGASVVRLASSLNMIGGEYPGAAEAGIQSHQIEWSRAGSEVAVHYFEQENALPLMYSGGVVEVRGETRVWGSRRADLGVGVRFVQETIGRTGLELDSPFRMADVSTTGSQRFGGDRLELTYGIRARVGAEALSSWSPETGAVLKLTAGTSLIVSGQMKVAESADRWFVWPALVRFDEVSVGSAASPRYRYGLGIVTGDEKNAQFSALLSITAVDDPLTIIFDDLTSDVWDAYVLDTGDRHEELALRYRTSFARDRVAVDLQSTVARTTAPTEQDVERGFMSSRLRSLYLPSGTSVDIGYRRLSGDDSHHPAAFNFRGERLNLRMGQNLHLPLDLTLLLGVDLMRELPSASETDPAELRHRYVGGVALAF